MKRLVLRVAALGTVVVLGLIAIAQAQRGTKTSPPAADQSPLAGNESSAETAPQGIPAPADSGSLLRAETSTTIGPNPLRPEGLSAAPTAEVPRANVLTSAGREAAPAVDPPAADPPAVDLTSAEGPIGSVSADPFGLQAGGPGSPPGPGMGRVVLTGRGSPVEPPEELPPGLASEQADEPRLTRLPPPAESAVGPSAPLGAAGSSAVDRYPEVPAGVAEVGEPAPFRADPSAAPTSLSAPELAAPRGFGPSGAEGPAREAPLVGAGTGQPGSKQLEGPQCPQLTIQKVAPEAIQVGNAATFRVTVRNTGSVAAHDVEVRDQVPRGTRLIGTTPRASRGVRGELVWALGTLQPGDESSVEVQLEPIAEGEIGSVATVRFQADASARSVATKPELVVSTSAPEQVLIGEEITLTIEVSNPGSGVATDVVLEEHVPAGLQHPAGTDLEYEVGDLPPGESRKLQLTLVATRPGPLTNVLTARGQGNLRAEDHLRLEVTSPALDVAVAGPKRRYLDREATHQLSVYNPGTAPANQIELVAYLPSGLKFVSANNGGHYDEADRAVHWQLEELPVDVKGTVELVTLPTEAGEQTIRLRGTADRGLSSEAEQAVVVEGIAAIMFQMVDVTDPIEVGGETAYEIRVLNQGSKAATNVRLALLLPGEMRAVAAEGPTRHAIEGNRVLFEGLPRLAPKADTTYRVRVQGLRPGDLRVYAQLTTTEMQTPVTKEESTRVYSDE